MATIEKNTSEVIATTTTTESTPANPNATMQLLELPDDYESKLTPAMRQNVESIVASIDIKNRDYVSNFGVEQQSSLGAFADKMLKDQRTKDLGESGQLINTALSQIQGYGNIVEGNGFLVKLMTRDPLKKIKYIQDKYKTVDKKLSIIEETLIQKKLSVSKIYDDFEILFQSNKETCEFLTLMIYAGEIALQQAKDKLNVMKNDTTIDPQDVRDFSESIIQFNKRLYNLKTTRAVSISLSPQIRSIQKSAIEVEDTLATTLVTSIPMWKTSIAMAIGIETVQSALNVSNAVTDANNAMLIKISEAGRDLAVASASANTRGVVDIETLRTVNQNTIAALTESNRIIQDSLNDQKGRERELDTLQKDLVATVRDINYATV